MEQQQAVTQIAEYSPIAAALADLNQRFKGLVFDVSTEVGLEQAKKARNEIRSYRTSLEAKRTELKAPILERGRLLDSEAKRITTELEVLEKPIAAQIDAEDRRREEERQRKILAEQQRVAAIGKRIDAIKAKVVAAVRFDATETQAAIDSINGIDLIEFAEFGDKAKAAIDETVAQLQGMLEAKQRAEAEAARIREENERLARERAEFERQQAEARQQAVAEEHARKIMEDAEREAREQAERNLARERAEVERQRRELEEKQAASAVADAEARQAEDASPFEPATPPADLAAAPSQEGAEPRAAAAPLNPSASWPFPSQRKREEAATLNVLLESVAALRRIHEIALDDDLDSYTVRQRVIEIAAPFIEQPEQAAV